MQAIPFHQHLLETNDGIWQKTLDHPFLTMVANGSIPDDTFKTWVAQDYLFVQAGIPFMGVLLTKAPAHLRPTLADAIVALHRELELFERQATAHGISLAVEMNPTCHAYAQFLLATVYDRPFEVSFTVLYAAEKAYLDAWERVKSLQQTASPWQAFINHWASDAFSNYVTWLATTLDELALGKSASDLHAMEQCFLQTARYEYLFWGMVTSGEQWPV